MKNKPLVIMGIVLLIIASAGIFYKEKQIDFINQNRIDIYDITKSGSTASSVDVYVDASYIDGPVATYENKEEHSFFVVFDKGVQHLLYIKNTDAKEIRNFLLDNPDKTYKIMGVTKSIPTGIEEYGKKFVKEWLDNNHNHSETEGNHSHDITNEEFYEYFGKVYLDATVNGESYYKVITIIIWITGLFGVTIIVYEIYETIKRRMK